MNLPLVGRVLTKELPLLLVLVVWSQEVRERQFALSSRRLEEPFLWKHAETIGWHVVKEQWTTASSAGEAKYEGAVVAKATAPSTSARET